MNEQFATVGDIEICYETFGRPEDPAVLLVMGLGTQMLGWHEDFCKEIAGRGFHVIRYDNRDVGRSTHYDDVPPPTVRELVLRRPKHLAYRLEDLADDGMGLLDALGIHAAHVVGASMGGMIAQLMAARHPARVLSLTSIMSTTGHRWKGQPALRVYPAFLGKPPRTKEESIERIVKLFKLVGSPGFERDEDELRATASLSYDRSSDPAGYARQLAAIIVATDRAQQLRSITMPTLVVHGTADKLVRPSGGKATARAIPQSRLLLIEGMGHDLPRGAWDKIVTAFAENAARGEARETQAHGEAATAAA
jgi:pimeloyl-ACP methyl ester carboxylesterase